MYPGLLYYRPPSNSREGNFFTGVICLYTEGEPSCDHYTWFIGPHCTVTPSQRHRTSWDLTARDISLDLFKLANFRESPGANIWWRSTISASRCYSSYCKALFILTDFEVKNISCILLHLNVSESRLKTKVIRSRASWDMDPRFTPSRGLMINPW